MERLSPRLDDLLVYYLSHSFWQRLGLFLSQKDRVVLHSDGPFIF